MSDDFIPYDPNAKQDFVPYTPPAKKPAPVVNAQGKSTYMPSEAAGPTPGASPFKPPLDVASRIRQLQQEVVASPIPAGIPSLRKKQLEIAQAQKAAKQKSIEQSGNGFGIPSASDMFSQVTGALSTPLENLNRFISGSMTGTPMAQSPPSVQQAINPGMVAAGQQGDLSATAVNNLSGFIEPSSLATLPFFPKTGIAGTLALMGGMSAPQIIEDVKAGNKKKLAVDLATAFGPAAIAHGAGKVMGLAKPKPELGPAEILQDFQQSPQQASDVPALTRLRLPGTTGPQAKLLPPAPDNAFVVDPQGNAQRANIGNLQNPDVLGRPNAIEKPPVPVNPYRKPSSMPAPAAVPVSPGEGQAPPRTQGEAALGNTHPNARETLEVHPLTGEDLKTKAQMQDAADSMNAMFPGSNAAVETIGRRTTLTIDSGWEKKGAAGQKPSVPQPSVAPAAPPSAPTPKATAEAPQTTGETPPGKEPEYDTLEDVERKRAGNIREKIQKRLNEELPYAAMPKEHQDIINAENEGGFETAERVNKVNKAAIILGRSGSTWADKIKARKIMHEMTGIDPSINSPRFGRMKGESEGSFAHRIRRDFSDNEWGLFTERINNLIDQAKTGGKPPEEPPSAPPPEGGGNIPVQPTAPTVKGPTNASTQQSATPMGEQSIGQEGTRPGGSAGMGPGQQGSETTRTGQAQTEGKTKPLKGENGPTPSIQRRVSIGGEPRTVVFPDEDHAALFSYASKLKHISKTGRAPAEGFSELAQAMASRFGPNADGVALKYSKEVVEGAKGIEELGRFAAPEIKPEKGFTIKNNPRRGSFDASIAEDVARAVQHGAELIGKKIVTFAKWSGEMVKEFGDTIRPHLVKLWDQSHDAFKAGATQKKDEPIPPDLQSRIGRLNAQTGKPEQKPTAGENIGNAIKGAWMAPSAWQTIATPFHAVLRHALPLTLNHPGMAAESIGQTWKAFASKEGFAQVREFIDNLPTKQMADHYGVADTGQHIADPTKGEEEMIGNAFLQKIPGGGSIVGGLKNAMNANHRGFVTYLDLMAQKGFAKKAAQLEEWGITPAKDEAAYKGLAGLINNERGRGSLGPLENQAALAAAVMYAPRLQVSRIALMNPVYYAKMEHGVRRIAITDAAKGIGVAVSAIMAAKAAGAEVPTDPRDSNFLKMKFGNRWVDPLGGFRSYVPLAVQSVTGQKVVGGQLKNNVGFGESRGTVAAKLAMQEVRKKFSPSMGMAYNLSPLSKDKDSINRNAVGDVSTPVSEAENVGTPFFGRDLLDYFKHNDIGSTIAGEIASQLGASSYEPSVRAPSFKSKGLGGANMKSLLKSGG